MSTELGAQRPSPISLVTALPLWRQLRWNLIVTCVVLAILPIAIFSSIALPRTRDQVRQQIVSQLQSVAELKAQETVRWLANSQAALELLYAGQNQRERFVLLATTELPTEVQVTAINSAFTDAVTVHAGFREFFLYDVQGKVLASSDSARIGTVVTQQPYYEQSLMGRYVQPPYYESGTNELTMIITRSVIDSSNRLVGILAGRLDLETLAQIMAERTGLGTSGETYLVSAQGGYFLTPSRFEGFPPDRAYHSLGIDRALAGQQGSATYTNYRGVATFGIYRWMPDLRAGLLAEYDQAEALQGVNQERTVSLILGILSVLFALILGLFAATRFSNPITALSQAAARIAGGDLTARARLRQRNELGVLARAFNNMADQIQDLVGALETRVAEHTRDLFLTLEVGQLATRTYQQAELLPRIVDFIRERFDLYYVQVFLLDGAQRDAILEAGTGEVGQQLLARKHRLNLHETSIVSRTVRSRRPVLVPNTDISPIHKPNPLLPDTRSEVAIPLIVGDQILGILDMQASQAETFREDNLPVFEAMASQLASALRAAQTYADVQTAIRRADIVNRRLTAGMWENYLGNLGDKGRLGYTYDLRAIEALDQPLAHQDSASDNGHGTHIARPVVLRHQAIGTITVGTGDERSLTPEDLELVDTVAERIALALDQYRAIDETHDSQRLLQTIIDTTPDWIFTKDRDYRFLLVNQAFAEFYGQRTPEEMVGKDDYDLGTPVELIEGDPEKEIVGFRTDDRAVIEKGETIHNPYDVVNYADGTLHVFDTTKLPLRDAEGNIIGLVGIGHDVTERIKAEQERAEREQLLRTVIDNLPDLVYAKDTQGRKLLSNKLDAHFMGLKSPDEAIGKTDFDFYPQEQAEQFFADDLQVIQSGEPVLNREEAFSVDGEPRWLLTTKVPLRDSQGRAIGLVGIGHEVTERRKAEEEVRKRAAEMQAVAEVGTEVTSLQDPEQLLWNVANLTKERFGLYHAHIYLVDDAHENLMLTAGAGEAGRVMVAAGHRILLSNPRSVVVRAARGRRAVIVNDVMATPDFLPNPLLPHTRSEMAIPLIVGSQVLGVLDVQGDQADRFTEEDTRVMKILASQIAVAVQNARQFEETQSSQQLLRLLIDNIPDHIYVKDRQGRFTIRNLAGARHMGAASPEEVIGKTDFDFYPPDVAAIYYAAEQDIIQTGQPLINQEEPIVDAEGHRGWILTTKMPLRNRQGDIIGLAGIGRDITGLKQAEQERAEREQLLRTLIDSLPDLVYVKDTESRYIVSNVAHAQFMGFASPDEAVGKTVFDVYPPDLAPQYYADDRSVIETGRLVEREEINVDSAGNRRWSWVTKVPFRDGRGRVVGLVGVARDISERKRSEETIRRYADEMETVAEVGTEAATSLEPNKLLQSVSDLTKERFGLYHAHIYLTDRAGKNLVLAAGAGQAGEVMVSAGHRIVMTHENSLVARAARTRQAVVANNVTLAPDFLPNPLLPETESEMAVPMIAGQRVIGVLDVQGDQVDRFTEEDMRLMTILAAQIAVSVQNAELYAEQVEVADRLREVDRLKSEFLASMSHELRTPLNSIIGYAEVLLDGIDGELTDDMTEDIGAIHGSGKHLLNLINDILDLAKIEAGQMDLVTERVKLRPLAEDVINTSRVLLRDKPVDLVLDLPDDLPELEGDALRLRQIVNNLLTNAIKFTEEGSIVLRASVYERDPRMVLIGVADTGIGIEQEHLPVIFDRFRQVDQSHTRRASGTGLGLSITRQLVQMHGGDIWVESNIGSGSIFYFTIPAATEESVTA